MFIAKPRRTAHIVRAAGIMTIAALAFAAAACGGSSSDKTPTSAPPTAAPTSAAAPTTSAPASSGTPAAGGAESTGTTGGTATVNIAASGTARFVDDKGLSLYVFGKDTPNSGTSACTGGCSTAWPALTVAAGTQPTAGQGVDGLGLITRSDGTMQVTYDGLPLYHYAGDAAPGDTTGKDIPNWALATP